MKSIPFLVVLLLYFQTSFAQLPLPCFDIWQQETLINFVGELETRCLQINSIPNDTYVSDNNSRSFFVDEGSIHLTNEVAIFPGSEAGGFQMVARDPSANDLEGVWFEPSNSYEVPIYEKTEWGVALPEGVDIAIQNWITNDQTSSNLSPAMNPFNPEEIDVWAEIITPGSSVPEIIYGFYFVPFDRIWSGNNPENLPEMDDPDNWYRKKNSTLYPFRFRYAPKVEGHYFVRLHMTLSNDYDFQSVTFPFRAMYANPQNGFVGLSPNGRYFELPSNQVFFPVGPELAHSTCECNRKYQSSNQYPLNWLGQPDEHLELNCEECYWNGLNNYCCGLDEFTNSLGGGNPLDWRYSFWRGYDGNVERYTEHIAAYLENLRKIEIAADEGANAFRTILSPITYDFEFEKLNNYYDRQFMAWELDEMINKAHDENLRIEMTMLLHNPFTKEHSNNFDWTDEVPDVSSVPVGNCYYTERDLTGCTSEPITFMSEPGAKIYYKRKLRYFFARYGYSKNIYLLDLFSEINNIGSREDDWSIWMTSNQEPQMSYLTSADARYIAAEWQTEMADYIKNELNHRNHLISATYTGIPYKSDDLESIQIETSDPENPSVNVLGRNSSDFTWASPLIDVHAYSSYANTLNRWQKWSDLEGATDWTDLQFEAPSGGFGSHPMLLDPVPYESINKPVVHPESGSNDIYAGIDNSSVVRDLWAHGFSGFAATGGNWWDQTPSENWANYDNILNFMNDHLFNEISVRTTHEWLTGYENDDNKKVEVIYMYRPGDDPKAVGIIFNLNYNPSNMCDPDDWPFLTDHDFLDLEARINYYENVNNEFEGDYYLNESDDNFNVDLENANAPFLSEMGLCDEYEITYYHPWNQSELATEHDNTSLVNDRLRLKNIPTLTVNMPFVLFTAHRTGSCVEGWFGMEGQDMGNIDFEAQKTFNSNEELPIVSISNFKTMSSIDCYLLPNPTIDVFRIASVSPPLSVSVFDAQGRILLDQCMSNNTYDMTAFPSGTYFVRVALIDEIFNFKLIKL